MTTPAAFRYRAWGLTIASEIDLAPFLFAEARQMPVDVHVRLRRSPPAGAAVQGGDASLQRVRLAWPGLTIDVRDGEDLEVYADASTPGDVLAAFVTGPGLAAAQTQRGYLVLHASAVRVAGVVVALTAPSGGGKSTLAVLLANCGASYLADDLVVVDGRVAPPVMLVGPAYAKVAARQLVPGWTVSGRESIDQRWVVRPPVEMVVDGACLPLGMIGIVDDARPGESVRLERLHGSRAVVEVAAADFADPMRVEGARATQLQRARDIAAVVPVMRVTRPRRLDVGVDVFLALTGSIGSDRARLV